MATASAFLFLGARPSRSTFNTSSNWCCVAPGNEYSASNWSYLNRISNPSSDGVAVNPLGASKIGTPCPIPSKSLSGETPNDEAKRRIADKAGFRSPRSTPPIYDLSSPEASARFSWVIERESRNRRTFAPNASLPESPIIGYSVYVTKACLRTNRTNYSKGPQ